MKVIANSPELNKFCHQLKDEEFITVDLEFLREKTYYAQLCLIQVGSKRECAIIDPLADGLDMKPFFELLQNPKVVKVFHSGRQDIEILYKLSGKIPQPIFDTQVAGMVCGFGESISYENLVKNILHIDLDKSSRLSDWSKRPLVESQLNYAISDVTHLVPIYEYLRDRLAESGRLSWLDEEMEILSNPATYVVQPFEAWQRIKHRSHSPYFLTLLRELAAWREERSQRRDTPRQSFIKDDCLLTIAAMNPKNMEELAAIRNIRKDVASGKLAGEILDVLQQANNILPENYVVPPKEKSLPNGSGSLFELLKLLLKIKSQEDGVVARLIASDDDLKLFSVGRDKHNPILKGWRMEIFGHDALALRAGELMLGFNPESKKIEFKR